MGATNDFVSSWGEIILLYKPKKNGTNHIKKGIGGDREEQDDMKDSSMQKKSLVMTII